MRDKQKQRMTSGKKQTLLGFTAGLLTSLVIGVPMPIWFTAGIVTFFFYGVVCWINPPVQRFVYVFVGFFIGITISFIIGYLFFDWFKFKI
jgi:uncharacterized membrane protein YccC